jgi:hypothetical protein
MYLSSENDALPHQPKRGDLAKVLLGSRAPCGWFLSLIPSVLFFILV